MKKKIIIAAVAALVIGVFIPIPKTYADGTKSYNAIAYKIVNWNRPFYKNLVYTDKDVYRFPYSLKSVDKLWNSMIIDPAVSEFKGTVVDTAGDSASVEVIEGSGEILPGEIVEITADNLDNKDIVRVEYVPDNGKVGKIVDVNKESSSEKETTLMFEDSAVFIKSTRECEKYIIPVKVQLSQDKDAVTVKEIFGRYQFKTDPYDNLPDYEITIGAHRFLYESSSGIVTDTVIKKVNEEQSIVLSKADRETINNLIQKYYESTTTIKSTSPVPDTRISDPDDSIHYVRLSWDSSADYPQVVFIRNRAQYDALIADEKANYSGNDGVFDRKYTDKFFEDRALVVIFTSESSGSNYYTGVKMNSDKNEIYVNRYIPEVRTCDMASWAIICEVQANDPILAKDNAKTQVIFTE